MSKAQCSFTISHASIYIHSRIGHLLPTGLELDCAIGLFHIHGYKDECFFHFATSFIPGTGVTVGEILEMLWSSLNSIMPTVQTATLANRPEMIDDHATDSNFKKLLNIGRDHLLTFECRPAHELL